MMQVRAPRNKEEKGRGNWGARTGLPTTPPSSRTSGCKPQREAQEEERPVATLPSASKLLSADFYRRELHFWQLLWGLSCSPKALVARGGYNTRFLPPTLPTSGSQGTLAGYTRLVSIPLSAHCTAMPTASSTTWSVRAGAEADCKTATYCCVVIVVLLLWAHACARVMRNGGPILDLPSRQTCKHDPPTPATFTRAILGGFHENGWHAYCCCWPAVSVRSRNLTCSRKVVTQVGIFNHRARDG